MLSGASAKSIKDKVKIFLLPEHKKVHGRPIYHAEAEQCGLAIEVADADSARWSTVYELYVRTRDFVGRKVAKLIETEEQSFYAHASSAGEGDSDA